MPKHLTRSQRHAQLERDAHSFLGLLEQLTLGREQLGGLALQDCKAVGYVSERTLGLGVGLSSSSGFIVRRLEGDGRWSAPCYLTSRGISLGLLMGTMWRQSLVCIDDDPSIERLLGKEAYGRLSMHSTDRARGAAQLSYDVDQGCLLGAALKLSRVRINHALNHELMGPNASPAELLNGEVAQPVEFADVYGELNRLSTWEEDPSSWGAGTPRWEEDSTASPLPDLSPKLQPSAAGLMPAMDGSSPGGAAQPGGTVPSKADPAGGASRAGDVGSAPSCEVKGRSRWRWWPVRRSAAGGGEGGAQQTAALGKHYAGAQGGSGCRKWARYRQRVRPVSVECIVGSSWHVQVA